jgi:hypothetical protein
MEGGMQPERKKNRRSQQRERLLFASMRAEDDAVVYLHKFDPAVALATACSSGANIGDHMGSGTRENAATTRSA